MTEEALGSSIPDGRIPDGRIPDGRIPDGDSIMVQVVDVSTGREISWGGTAVERLSRRVADVHAAIAAGIRAVVLDLDKVPVTGAWQVSELSASFGVTLAAEAGVVLSKAGTEATFEVTVTLRRT